MRGNAGDVLFYKREREGVTLEPDKKKGLAAKDLAFSIVLIIFSIYIIVTSLGLKYFNTFIDGADACSGYRSSVCSRQMRRCEGIKEVFVK